jgi:ribose transport system substrate-binding protein
MNWAYKQAALSAAALAAVLTTGACTGTRHAPEERFFLIASNNKLAYWQEAAKGLTAAANTMRVRADFAGPDTYDPKEQRDAFKRAVAAKPSGIMISVADPAMMKDEINSAIAAGIPVITMDSDSPGSNRLFFIGTNNYQAGLMGGRVLVQKLGRKGNVVVLTIPAQANLIDRLRGYEDAIASTDIKIVQTVDVQGNPAVAFDKTMEITEKANIKVDAFVCMEATACSEVAEVLSRRKVTGKLIIAMDTNEETLNWIDKGVIAATIGQKPYTMAYYGLHLLDDLHHNKPEPLDASWVRDPEAKVPSAVDTGSTLIDSTNLNLIRKPGGGK